MKVNFHTKFHQNWTKIVEVSQSRVVGGGVGWLGWLGGSIFSIGSFPKQIIKIRHHTKFQLDISRRSKVIQSWNLHGDIRHPTSIHPYIRHQPLSNYSPRRNLFRRGQKIYKNVILFKIQNSSSCFMTIFFQKYVLLLNKKSPICWMINLFHTFFIYLTFSMQISDFQ